MARILIIEDNPANMQLMVYLLRAFGHETLEAQAGQAGLATAQNDLPDLILCDLQMPGMDGYEVARRLKLIPGLKAISLVAVTAYAMVGDRDRILAAGFDGYISKPINAEQFVKQVEIFLPPDTHAGSSKPSNLQS
jgi:Response regulator containing a CheY-like receiver domain and an HD-GYP domain